MTTRTDTLAVKIDVSGDGQAKASLATVEKSLDNIKQKAADGGAGFDRLATAARGAAAGLTAGAVATWLVQSIADAQRLATQLRAVTGSQSETNTVLAMSQRLAYQSAESADQLTRAYIALAQRGLRPTQDTMLALANVASGTGRTIEDVADSVSAALGGQYRSLEQLGIKVEETGGVLTGTFRGVTTVIGSSSAEIIGYMRQIGENDFGSAAAREAETLAGRWGQLKQAAGDLAEGIGDTGLLSLLTAITRASADAARGIGSLIDKIKDFDPSALLYLQNPAALGSLGVSQRLQTEKEDASPGLREQAEGVLDRVLEKYHEIKLAVDQKTQAENENAAKANEAGQRVLESLERQQVAVLQGEGASIRYAAAQAAAKVADADLSAQIIATGNAIAKQVEAKAADEKATKSSAEAKRAAAKDEREQEKARAAALKELKDLQDAYNEGVDHMRALMETEEETQRGVHDAYASIVDILDPYGREVRELEAAYAALVKSQAAAAAAGLLTTAAAEDQNKALAELKVRIDEAAKAADEARARGNVVDWLSGVTGDKESAGQALDQLMTGAAAVFTKALKTGFKDAGKDFEDLLESIGDTLINGIIKDKLIKQLQNAAGGGSVDWGQAAQGAGVVGGAWAGGEIGGGGERATEYAATGAAMGAVIGSIIPVIGTILGAVIGGIIGGIAGGVLDSRSTSKVYSGPYTGQGAWQSGISAFGQVNAYAYGMGDSAESELLQAVIGLDNAIAKLLTYEEQQAVKSALEGHVFESKSPEQTLADRLSFIIATVEPEWVAFLTKFRDLESKAAAFGALRNLDATVKDFDRILAMVGSPMEQLRDQMKAFDDAVDDTRMALTQAIGAQDPVRIEQAASASVDAIVNRYNAEIELAQTLEAAIASARQQAYQLQMTLAQRIAGITGSNADVIALSGGRIGELQGSIPGMTPGAGMGALNDYIGAVDTWLSAGTNDINNWLNGALGALQAQAQAQQAAAQRAAAARQAAHQREIQALQQQLELAQLWIGVLDQAKQLQESMQFGESNPMGGFGQLDALNQAIDRLIRIQVPEGGTLDVGSLLDYGGGIQNLDAEGASRLLDLLQQRLALIQSQDLLQRPSGEYLEQYNQTLALIEQVRQLAQPEVDRAEELQLQLIDLQAQTVGAVSSGTAGIAAQEAALRQEAKERLDALNAQALDYYNWARDQAQALEDERTQELREQLEALTGGLPVQDFIALKQHEANVLLTSIRDDLRIFLAAISGGAVHVDDLGTGATGGGTQPDPNPGAGGGDGGNQTGQGSVNVQVVINAAGMSREEVVRTFHQEVRHAASDIKRVLQVA